MRCVRHAFDSRCKPMDKGQGSLIIDEDGDIGIRLGHKVPASMRKNIYDTELVLTAKKLLCCKCTCQCGSQGLERIVCVHTLVLAYLLSMLLIEDLAEHILIALAARINGSFETETEDSEDVDQQWLWNMSNWSENDIKSMKDSVVVLMDAAGEQTSTNDCNKSLPELLRSFVVGTEGRKEWKQRTKLPPKPSELGPVKDKVFMSTARRARLTLRRVDQTMDKSSKGKVGTRVQPQNMPEHANSCACYWPGCSVDESSPPQTMVECKMESCHRKVHPLCQDLAETANEWIHQENQPYCCECHPKQPIPSGACQEDALFSPNYTNVVSLMKSAGCDMDDSPCAGFQLLSCRYVDEFNSTERKLALKNVNKAEKEAKGKWKKLQKLAEHRSTNQTHSQLTNLTKRSHEAISVADDPAEEKEATPDRSSNVGPTITPSPDNRHNLRRRAQPLPITLPPPPPPPKPKRGKYVAAPLTIIIQAWPISVKSLSSRENSQLRNQNGNR